MGCTCGKGKKSRESTVQTTGKRTRVIETREIRKDGKTTKVVITRKPVETIEITTKVTNKGGGKPETADKTRKQPKDKQIKGKQPKGNQTKLSKDEKAKVKKSIKEDVKEGLKAHNNYRNKHKVSGLKTNSGLNKGAQKWAETLLKTNRFEHADKKSREHRGKYVGENIAYYQGSGEYSAADATKSWYDEINKYSFNAPGTRAGTGHFTQVVWKDTKELGIGRAEDPRTGKVIIVGRYLPGGNVVGKYPDNVLRPR